MGKNSRIINTSSNKFSLHFKGFLPLVKSLLYIWLLNYRYTLILRAFKFSFKVKCRSPKTKILDN